jgi:hypothetical protein
MYLVAGQACAPVPQDLCSVADTVLVEVGHTNCLGQTLPQKKEDAEILSE